MIRGRRDLMLGALPNYPRATFAVLDAAGHGLASGSVPETV